MLERLIASSPIQLQLDLLAHSNDAIHDREAQGFSPNSLDPFPRERVGSGYKTKFSEDLFILPHKRRIYAGARLVTDCTTVTLVRMRAER